MLKTPFLISGVTALLVVAGAHAQSFVQSSSGGGGTANVTVGSVSLRANYEMTPAGLRTTVSAFDRADPLAQPFHEVLILKKGQERTIELPRGSDQPPVRVVIARVGNGLQVSAGSESDS